jgi:hypothetical protein
LLLYFRSHSPASFSLRGSPDGVLVALRLGDQHAIREGVTAGCHDLLDAEVSRTPDFPRLFGCVSSIGYSHAIAQWVCFCILLFDITPLEVLRRASGPLLTMFEVGLLLHFPSPLPRIFLSAGESGWRAGRSPAWRPACHSGGGGCRLPRPPRCRGFPEPPIFLDYLASFRKFTTRTRSHSGFVFAPCSSTSRHLRSFAEPHDHLSRCSKWVCFCTFAVHACPPGPSRTQDHRSTMSRGGFVYVISHASKPPTPNDRGAPMRTPRT